MVFRENTVTSGLLSIVHFLRQLSFEVVFVFFKPVPSPLKPAWAVAASPNSPVPGPSGDRTPVARMEDEKKKEEVINISGLNQSIPNLAFAFVVILFLCRTE